MGPSQDSDDQPATPRTGDNHDSVMVAVARLAKEAFPACDAASITVVEDGHPHTAASTHDDALAIDEQQYESGDGPCLCAVRTVEVVRVDSFEDDPRWAAVAAAALARGKHSSLSLPLVVDGRAFGALNLYSDDIEGFIGAEGVGKTFAAPAAVAVASATSLEEATALAHHLALALEHRDIIGQAKGILMASNGLTSDEAFTMLTKASQRENRKLYAIAEEIVARRSEQ